MRDPETAFFHGLFRAILAVLIGLVLMSCYGADAGGALRIGAHVALLYALALIVDAPRWPRRSAQFHMLRFAKSASALAITLAGSAMFV